MCYIYIHSVVQEMIYTHPVLYNIMVNIKLVHYIANSDSHHDNLDMK